MTQPEQSPPTNETRTVPRDVDFDDLMALLIAANIPVESYGLGNTKTLEHLVTEIRDGESTLSVNVAGDIHRHVDALGLDMLCHA